MEGFTLAGRGEGPAAVNEPLKFVDVAMRRAHELDAMGMATDLGIPAANGGVNKVDVTLQDFSLWFCRRFALIEAAREAKHMIEV